MRRNSISGFLLLLFLSVISCRPKYSPKPEQIIFNDFESVAGWTNTPTNNSNTVVSEDAHSGKFSYKIDNSHSYGYFYKRKLADISSKKISWIRISGYCKAKSEKLNKACIVCSIQDEANVYHKWTGAFLQEFTEGKKDKWIYFEKNFDINSVNDPGFFMSAFVWSADTADVVLIDDFKIELFD